MAKKSTTEEFVRRAKLVHGDEYDYSEVKYVNSVTKVCIHCNKCGRVFFQTPSSHLSGRGCTFCSHPHEKSNIEEFIRKSRLIHGNKYDYNKSVYITARTPVEIICKEHGSFWQLPNSHLSGQGCPLCCKSHKIDTKEFIKRAIKKHGDKYDYSSVKYVDTSTKVEIICPKHGMFKQTPAMHLYGNGCPECGNESRRKNKLYDLDVFIKKARTVHGDKYNYDKTKYKNSQTKVCITCPNHGDFCQRPSSHLKGCGCPACKNDKTKERCSLSKDEFVRRAKISHPSKNYDYSKVEYTSLKDKVCIICPEHGEFWQNAYNHLNGSCCPHCQVSFGENLVKVCLNEMNVKYEQQYKIINEGVLCENNKLLVDFYLPEHNIIIEYNGIQHYRPIKRFGGDEQFQRQIKRDEYLKEYCDKNKIQLIIIPYTKKKHINNILKEKIKNHG